MRPRWHFMLQSVLAVTGGIFLGLSLLYLVSFIFFVLRQSGILFVPVLGSGYWQLLVSLPWVLILLAVVFIVVLELLVRNFAFSYRRPLLYSVAGILLFVIVGGSLVAATSFHRRVFVSMERRHVPLAGAFYRAYERPLIRNLERGVITTTTNQGFVIVNQVGDVLTVIITPRTRLPLGADFSLGDQVVVFGERRGAAVPAFGIQEVSKD